MPKESSHRPRWVDDLLDLAAEEATGRLVVAAPGGDEGWIHLRDGGIALVSADARRPLLSRRLTAFAVMTADEVRAVMDRARATPGTKLLDLLVHDRLVPEAFVSGYLRNTMAEQLGALMTADVTSVHFEPGRVQRVPLLQSPHDVIAVASAVPQTFPGDIAEHVLTGAGGKHRDLIPILRSVLKAADGTTRPIDVADACGLTAAETLQVITDLQGKGLLEVAADSGHEGWHGGGSLSLAPPVGPAMDAPVTAPPPAAARPAPPPPPARPSPAPAAAATDTPPVIKPFAPEPVEPETHAPAAQAGTQDRREALSALKSLTEAVAAEAEPPVPHVPPVKDPQSEVTTTSPRIWSTRPSRPSDPMESGDVLRELKSLGD